MAILPLRYPASGPPYDARDGVIVVLFARESHAVLAPRVGVLLDAYLALVGDDALRFIVGSEEWKSLTPRRRARARRRLSAAAADGPPDDFLVMKGGADEASVGEHGFLYVGTNLEPERRKRHVSGVELWFPTEAVLARGLDAFCRDVMALAATIPFSSGYCSLAFDVEDDAWIDVARHVTTPLAMRHPGMDLHMLDNTASFMGDGVRGAYWLTFVGPAALGALALDAAGLREALHDPAIAVHELPQGVAIRAGDELRPGDVNDGDRLPLTRKVAAVLEPVTVLQRCAAFGFATPDPLTSFIEWQRRHLD